MAPPAFNPERVEVRTWNVAATYGDHGVDGAVVPGQESVGEREREGDGERDKRLRALT